MVLRATGGILIPDGYRKKRGGRQEGEWRKEERKRLGFFEYPTSHSIPQGPNFLSVTSTSQRFYHPPRTGPSWDQTFHTWALSPPPDTIAEGALSSKLWRALVALQSPPHHADCCSVPQSARASEPRLHTNYAPASLGAKSRFESLYVCPLHVSNSKHSLGLDSDASFLPSFLN